MKDLYIWDKYCSPHNKVENSDNIYPAQMLLFKVNSVEFQKKRVNTSVFKTKNRRESIIQELNNIRSMCTVEWIFHIILNFS